MPLQYASAGAPPLETWLDRYMSKTLGIPYYVTFALEHDLPVITIDELIRFRHQEEALAM